MNEENGRNKLYFLKRLEYLQKQELKAKLAIKISREEKDETALKRFSDDLEKIQKEIDFIIGLLSKDTEIREKCMQQWDRLNYEEIKATYGVKFSNDENNKKAAEKFENDLIKAKVRKKKVEDLLNSSYMFREKPKKMYMNGSKKKKTEEFLKYNSDDKLDVEVENTKHIADIQDGLNKVKKIDDDKKLAREYMDD